MGLEVQILPHEGVDFDVFRSLGYTHTAFHCVCTVKSMTCHVMTLNDIQLQCYHMEKSGLLSLLVSTRTSPCGRRYTTARCIGVLPRKVIGRVLHSQRNQA